MEEFARNDLYEYKVETLRDDRTGEINVEELQRILTRMAANGWRLKTTMTNELGKNKTSVGYGGISVGTNATIEETILIFERKIRTASEIDEINRLVQEEEQKRIEREKKLKEKERKELSSMGDTVSAEMDSDELYAIYRKVPDKKNMIFNLIVSIDNPVSLVELRGIFEDKIDLMELGSFVTALTNEGKLRKDEETKKYSVVEAE